MPFLSLLWKKNNLASKTASTFHQHLTSWRGGGTMDQSKHQCFLEYQVCLFFCYRSTSFSNNPFSYLSLNKYVFQANPVLFQIIVYWCQINMHMHTSGLHLSTTHKSTLTIPTAHSFSSKCSSTAPSPAKYSYLPFHVSISTWAATGQAVSRNWYPWKLLSGKKKR